jgi:hypothetical protein
MGLVDEELPRSQSTPLFCSSSSSSSSRQSVGAAVVIAVEASGDAVAVLSQWVYSL